MNDYDISESNKPIPAADNLPVEFSLEKKEDRIRLLSRIDKKCNAVISIWKYLTLVIAFITIFLAVYFISVGDTKEDGKPTDIINNSENSPKDETDNVTTSARPQRIPLTVINESGLELNIDSYQGSNILSSLPHDSENDIRILVVNSHSSEFVSENISVSEAGLVITQLLQSAGIGTEYCVEVFDKGGRIGAYKMMKEMIRSELTRKHELVLVIDIHSSDSGTPITFTVGTGSGFGWEENLRVALGVIDNLDDIETSVRFLPADLGQNSGIVTLNIGICGADDKSARRAISALVNAIINLYNENPRKDPGIILDHSNFGKRKTGFRKNESDGIHIGRKLALRSDTVFLRIPVDDTGREISLDLFVSG